MAQIPLHEVGQEPDPRVTLVNERTLLAWNRTALALIGGGLAAGRLLQFRTPTVGLVVSLVPILLGALLAAGAYRHWAANERALRLGEPLPIGSAPRRLAIALVGLAATLSALRVAAA